ncbi:MAG TPA: YggS family pyridoxal phosphate-dependent enzyme [Thermotogota bacterium]|nr:YggS family pyridoxal phosphate-dependent enzyme [Thermotogota bacterium]
MASVRTGAFFIGGDDMTQTQKNITELKEKIKKICQACGRNVDEIKLVAVSKTFPIEAIEEVIETGQMAFGENKAQEIRDKMESAASKEIEWHFIGPLQKNKVKYIAGKTALIHSVEDEKVAFEIDKRAAGEGKVQDILIEVNISGEKTKHGLDTHQAQTLIQNLQTFQNIRVIGLMTMAPFTDDEQVIRETFKGLRLLRDRLQLKFPLIQELSMGMTNDYSIAIEEGATLLRIGSAIFQR